MAKKGVVRNPTGKGGFQERPQDINVGGAPRKGQSWAESVKRLTDMTREEAIAYVGANTRLGKLLRELSPNVPIKDVLILISIIHYGRDPNASMLNALADREEGKPQQSLRLGGNAEEPLTIRIIKVSDAGNPTENQ